MKLFKKHIYIFGEKPQTDWRRILITSTIFALAMAVYGFIFYRQISLNNNDLHLPEVNLEPSASTSTVQAEVGDSKLELNQIIELYLKKKDTFEKMNNELKKS